ncbi:MAG: N-acetylneuraminate synthase family protein [Phycisphaerae bacterium]
MTDNPSMHTLGIILARAGSKGLPEKCVAPLRGRPMIEYTFDHALASLRLDQLVLSTDSKAAKVCAAGRGITVIDRPASLATDQALIDAACRHAVLAHEAEVGASYDAVVILYANIPVRRAGMIDGAIERLAETGADSVRSVAPVGKHHPDWLHRLDGDRMAQFRPNSISRRQDLEPVYYHDGAVIAVTRASLFAAADCPSDGQAFLGNDRRAIIVAPDDAVDVDERADLYHAEALLRTKSDHATSSRVVRDHRAETPAHRIPTSVVSIGARRVGAGQAPYVIAEIGVNHDGDVRKALKLVDVAKAGGADAAKFQVFDIDELVAPGAASAAYQRESCGAETQASMLRSLVLPDDSWRTIREYCEQRSIDFIATPFGETALTRLISWHPAAIKLGSGDLTNRMLFDGALRSGIPVIFSTGASHGDEIDRAVSLARRGAPGRVVVMHCVSCYPAPVDRLNLACIRTMQARYGIPVGFSDHSPSTASGGWAVAAGASVIEKHITLDPLAAGPDHAASLGPEAFADYVQQIHHSHAAFGNGAIGMAPEEQDVRTAARRSVMAKVDIPKGAVISMDMLICKRPGLGIPADQIERLVDRVALDDIPRDTVLAWDQLD